MMTAIVLWLLLQVLLGIVVGKFLKVSSEPGRTEAGVQATSTDDRSLLKAA